METSRKFRRVALIAALFLGFAPMASAQTTSSSTDSSVSSQLMSDGRQLAKNFAHDQLRIFESPVRDVAQKPRNAMYLLPFVVAGALIPVDRHIEPTFSSGTQTAAQRISDVSLYGTAATIGGLYIYGLAGHNDHAQETGVLGTESLVDELVVKELTNVISGRLRPEEGDHHGDFFVNHSLFSSFPAGHPSATWAMATVIADEYPSTKSRVLWYTVASAAAAARVVGRKHFTSDVIVGSTMGYLIGRYVFHAHSHHGSRLR